MNVRYGRGTMAFLTAIAAASGAVASEPAELGTARAAVTAAEKAVLAAREQNALWTTAEEALRQARRALDSGDPAKAGDYARFASEQARLGIAQKRLPLTRSEP